MSYLQRFAEHGLGPSESEQKQKDIADELNRLWQEKVKEKGSCSWADLIFTIEQPPQSLKLYDPKKVTYSGPRYGVRIPDET